MLNIALIGTGYWGKKLQPYIKEEFNLKYICNSKSNLEWDIDAVVIATPNETHYSLAKIALLKGKHVLVEKPLAETLEECIELRNLSKKLVLLTDYVYTFSESLQKVVSLTSRIGRIENIDITLKRSDRLKNRDVYQVLGSHALSILSMFVPLDSLEFQKDNGVMTHNKGRIFLDLKGGRKTEIVIYGQRGKVTHNFNEQHTLRHVIRYFARAIKGEVRDNLPLALSITRILG